MKKVLPLAESRLPSTSGNHRHESTGVSSSSRLGHSLPVESGGSVIGEYLGKMARHAMDCDAHTANRIDTKWVCRSSRKQKRGGHPFALVSLGMMLA